MSSYLLVCCSESDQNLQKTWRNPATGLVTFLFQCLAYCCGRRTLLCVFEVATRVLAMRWTAKCTRGMATRARRLVGTPQRRTSYFAMIQYLCWSGLSHSRMQPPTRTESHNNGGDPRTCYCVRTHRHVGLVRFHRIVGATQGSSRCNAGK